MAKHDVALMELRRALNKLTAESKYAADRRIWLRQNISYDEDHGRTPEPKHVTEFAEMDAKVKSNYIKIESLIASLGVLEDDDV